jgi:ribosomal protein L37AE/L43A
MGWYEAIKDAATIADKLRSAELKQKLADIQVECANLAADNARLRQENLDLREQLQTRDHMEFRDNVYWRRGSGDMLEGPFCPKCRDGAKKSARMEDRPDDHFWRCRVCGTVVEKPGPDPNAQTFVDDWSPLTRCR